MKHLIRPKFALRIALLIIFLVFPIWISCAIASEPFINDLDARYEKSQIESGRIAIIQIDGQQAYWVMCDLNQSCDVFLVNDTGKDYLIQNNGTYLNARDEIWKAREIMSFNLSISPYNTTLYFIMKNPSNATAEYQLWIAGAANFPEMESSYNWNLIIGYILIGFAFGIPIVLWIAASWPKKGGETRG